MTSAALPSSSGPLVLADVVPGARVKDAVLVVGGAGFVGLMAQLSFPLAGTPVPVTMQTFGALAVGAALGTWRGAFSLLIYLLVGAANLIPWFADGSGGGDVVGGPTFGYIIGFVVAAAVAGRLAERGKDRRVVETLGLMLLGTVTIFAVGVPWLAVSADLTAGAALEAGLWPFLPGAVLKIALAAGLLPAVWAGVRAFRGDDA